MPYVMIETTYEGEHNASAVQIRRQAYWALLYGAAGQFMGNRPIWLFDPGWQAALDGTASRGMARVQALFRSRAGGTWRVGGWLSARAWCVAGGRTRINNL